MAGNERSSFEGSLPLNTMMYSLNNDVYMTYLILLLFIRGDINMLVLITHVLLLMTCFYV